MTLEQIAIQIAVLGEKVDATHNSVQELKDKGMPVCAQHAEQIVTLFKSHETLVRRMDSLNGWGKPKTELSDDGGRFGKWTIGIGNLKAMGMPAVILSVLIGLAVFQYVQNRIAVSSFERKITGLENKVMMTHMQGREKPE